jgi:hypothetical protein
LHADAPRGLNQTAPRLQRAPSRGPCHQGAEQNPSWPQLGKKHSRDRAWNCHRLDRPGCPLGSTFHNHALSLEGGEGLDSQAQCALAGGESEQCWRRWRFAFGRVAPVAQLRDECIRRLPNQRTPGAKELLKEARAAERGRDRRQHLALGRGRLKANRQEAAHHPQAGRQAETPS